MIYNRHSDQHDIRAVTILSKLISWYKWQIVPSVRSFTASCIFEKGMKSIKKLFQVWK